MASQEAEAQRRLNEASQRHDEAERELQTKVERAAQHTKDVLEKHYFLLLVLAFLFGAKAFAQEWEWRYSQPERTYSGFMETHELLDGRILATGAFHDKNICGNYVFQHPVFWSELEKFYIFATDII